MPCFHPITAFYDRVASAVSFSRNKHDGDELQLPCGRCIGCRLEHSRQWAVRCVHEASLHERNVFITLTYADEFLPPLRSLMYSDFQKFMRRLRKSAPHEVRFFMCGEYGEGLGRPHYHACLFGHDFDDKYFYRSTPSGSRLYRSPTLERLWPFGHSSLGEVTFESAAYVARYVTKKITGDPAQAHYQVLDPDSGEVLGDRTPEFCHMSLKPGIGNNWFLLYWPELISGQVRVNGVDASVPRYYLKKMKNLLSHDDLEYRRHIHAQATAHDRTPERLSDRETVANARSQLSKRSLK